MMSGLELYDRQYVKLRYNPKFLEASEALEKKGKDLARGLLDRSTYVEHFAMPAARFLLDVQSWKSLYLDPQHDAYIMLPPRQVAGAVFDFFEAEAMADKLEPLLQLFGKDATLAVRTSRAMALARFLDPVHWAIVGWRSFSLLGYRNMTALKDHRLGTNPDEVRQLFDPTDSTTMEDALHHLRSYCSADLPRAVDVELAFFAISLDIWRGGKVRENLRRALN